MAHRMGWTAILGLAGMLALTGPGATPVQADQALLVIPARYRIVQLAFDVARVSDAMVVSYQKSATVGALQMHRWDGRSWLPLPEEDYLTGMFPRRGITQGFVIGTDAATVDQLLGASAWLPAMRSIDTLGLAAILNTLDEALDLSPANLRWLAARYGLAVEDLNWERRRYGRFGPPSARTAEPERRRVEWFPTDAQNTQPRELESDEDASPAPIVTVPVRMAPEPDPLEEDVEADEPADRDVSEAAEAARRDATPSAVKGVEPAMDASDADASDMELLPAVPRADMEPDMEEPAEPKTMPIEAAAPEAAVDPSAK